jgi:hypothetical protein
VVRSRVLPPTGSKLLRVFSELSRLTFSLAVASVKGSDSWRVHIFGKNICECTEPPLGGVGAWSSDLGGTVIGKTCGLDTQNARVGVADWALSGTTWPSEPTVRSYQYPYQFLINEATATRQVDYNALIYWLPGTDSNRRPTD